MRDKNGRHEQQHDEANDRDGGIHGVHGLGVEHHFIARRNWHAGRSLPAKAWLHIVVRDRLLPTRARGAKLVEVAGVTNWTRIRRTPSDLRRAAIFVPRARRWHNRGTGTRVTHKIDLCGSGFPVSACRSARVMDLHTPAVREWYNLHAVAAT